MEIRFEINGERADYLKRDDFPISLTRNGLDLKDPGKRKSDRTWTLKLPRTKTNERLFGALHAPAVVDKFRTEKVFECRVFVGDEALISGLFYLTKASYDDYEGFVVANLGAAAPNFKDRSLRDVQLGLFGDYHSSVFKGAISALENVQEMATNLQSNPAEYRHDEKRIAFPLVAYGNYFVPNRWFAPEGNYISRTTYGLTDPNIQPAGDRLWPFIPLPQGREIFDNDEYAINLGSNAHIAFADNPPCVYVRQILLQMFEDAGWQLRGRWIDEENTRRLLMPYTNDRPPLWNWGTLGALNMRRCVRQLFIDITVQRTSIVPTVWYTIGVEANAQIEQQSLSSPTSPPAPGGDYPQPAPYADIYTAYGLLDFIEVVRDYGFNSIRLSYRNGATLETPRYRGFVAPADAEYRFTLEYTVGNNDKFTDNPTQLFPQSAGFVDRRTVGLSKISSDSLPTFIDGEWNWRQDLFGDGFEDNVIAVRDGTADVAPNSYSFQSPWVELNTGDIVVAWMAMMLPWQYFDEFPGDGAATVYTNQTLPILPPASPVFNTWSASYGITAATLTVQARPLSDTEPRDRFGDDLIIQQMLPDVKQLDFLKSILQLFNLYLTLDENTRVATLESVADYFAPNSTAHDITRKTSEKLMTVRPPDLPRIVDFVYTEDAEDFAAEGKAEEWSLRFDTEIGQAVDTAEVSSGIFSGTSMREYEIVEDAGGPTQTLANFLSPTWRTRRRVLIPCIADQEAFFTRQNDVQPWKYKWNPRLLMVGRAVPLSFGQTLNYRVWDDTIPVAAPWLPDPNDWTTGQFATREEYRDYTVHVELGFANPASPNDDPYRRLPFSGTDGLYEVYYRRQYDAFARGEEVELEMLMTPEDWRKMSLNRPVVYDGILYQLKEIKGYNPTKTGLTKVVLVRLK